MRSVFLYMNMTLDGYLSGPNNELDWFRPGQDDEMNKDVLRILDSSDSLMMGYPTAPGMMAYWEEVGKRKTDPEWMLDIANAMENKRVIVISNENEDLQMKDAELVVAKNDEGLISAVRRLKGDIGGNMCVLGGIRTAQRLSRLSLIDAYMLIVHPVAIGRGKPLFIGKTKLELVSTKPYSCGAMQVRYRPAKA